MSHSASYPPTVKGPKWPTSMHYAALLQRVRRQSNLKTKVENFPDRNRRGENQERIKYTKEHSTCQTEK